MQLSSPYSMRDSSIQKKVLLTYTRDLRRMLCIMICIRQRHLVNVNKVTCSHNVPNNHPLTSLSSSNSCAINEDVLYYQH